MAKLRGRKLPVTWQLPPEVVAIVEAFSKRWSLSKQVTAERLIMSGADHEIDKEREKHLE